MSETKPDTIVSLVAKDIYADLYQPVIVVKDGLIKIPQFNKITTPATGVCKWVNEINKIFKGKILAKIDKGHRYVAVSMTLREFLYSLPVELRSITSFYNNLETINKILDGDISLRPTEEELQHLIEKGLISSRRYDEEDDDELNDLEEEDY